MRKLAVLAYAVVAYAIGFASLVYLIGFLANVAVPRSIDSPRTGPLWTAVAVDVGLLLVFSVQHSVMARPGFKRQWTRVVPPAAERATYVLFSAIALALLYWLWQPIGGVVWDVTNSAGRAVLYGGLGLGWLIVLGVTFIINHFDLFGLRQAWLYFRGRPYTGMRFITPGPYRFVRHPLYVGWLLFFWCTPTMTAAHLLFAVLTTAYILVAIRYEERDLQDAFGAEYAAYRRRVPALVPLPCRRADEGEGRGDEAPVGEPSPVG